MATRFEIVLYGDDVPRLRAAGEEALREITRLERELSFFRQASIIGQINSRAATKPVRVSPDMFALLVRVKELWALTDGTFDPTVAPLLEAWGFRGPVERPPDEDGVAQELTRVGMNHVNLDVDRRSVSFDHTGVRLDLGGIGKGYALDVAARALKHAGVECGLMHGGTSTSVAIGSDPDGRPWRIGVANPGSRNGDDLAHVVEIHDEAMSVSAISGRVVESEDGRFGHVIDPRTGYPVRSVEMAVAVAASATDADALSTALLVLGTPGVEILDKNVVGFRGLVWGGEIGAEGRW